MYCHNLYTGEEEEVGPSLSLAARDGFSHQQYPPAAHRHPNAPTPWPEPVTWLISDLRLGQLWGTCSDMDPQTQLSLFGAWRHPMGGIQGIQGMGMDLTQAAYRYNQNMMEYYTCKSKS